MQKSKEVMNDGPFSRLSHAFGAFIQKMNLKDTKKYRPTEVDRIFFPRDDALEDNYRLLHPDAD